MSLLEFSFLLEKLGIVPYTVSTSESKVTACIKAEDVEPFRHIADGCGLNIKEVNFYKVGDILKTHSCYHKFSLTSTQDFISNRGIITFPIQFLPSIIKNLTSTL